MVTSVRSGARLSSVLVALFVLATANAEVVATVNRSTVDLNESFDLEVFVDANIDVDPDFSVLDENFYRSPADELSNTTIVNGQISRSRTWTVSLRAKATGTMTIPAIRVGGEQSEPIIVIVNEPKTVPPGEADVFVTSEVDRSEAYVQSQILYRVKIYRALQTRQPALRDASLTGVEALVERVGDDRSYEAILNDRAYDVIERVFAIYPQESGEIALSPSRFEARVLRNGRITGRKVYDSEAHTIRVLPRPEPPAEFPDAAWLPARDVTLTEDWSRLPDTVEAGEPITRHVTITALGQLETQIPALAPPDVDGLNVYEDKPELSRRVEADGIRGIRKDQYAMIGTRGGDVELPELAVPWWDIEAGEWRVATLPKKVIDVEAPPEPAAAPSATEDAPTEAAGAPTEGSESTALSGGFWKRAAQLMAAVWLLTLLVWSWSARGARRDREKREPEPLPVYKQQAQYVRAAKKAAASGDSSGMRNAVLEWARLQWPDSAPRSIGEIAGRVRAPLADELRKLSAASYGPNAADWNGAAIVKGLKSVVLIEDRPAAGAGDMLPPLMPPGTG